MAGNDFDFLVRRPLQSKDGALSSTKDGAQVQVAASARWPNFTLDGVECETLKRGVVHPRPEKDKTLGGTWGGQKGFCFEIVPSSGAVVQLFANSEQERGAWCVLLRKYSVHWNIENGFSVSSKILGTGSYATVKQARDKVSKVDVALKIIKKSCLNQEERGLLVDEVKIAQETKHKFCVMTHEFIESKDEYYIVMEAVMGGELFERIVYHRYSPDDVRAMFRQLLTGIAYLHSRQICHRDIKPENILLTQERPMTIKIADYGVATNANPGNLHCLKDGAQLRCSPGYGAPEIVKEQPYGMPVDMWSAGVTLFLLLTGVQPFNGKSTEQTRQLMIAGDYNDEALQSDPLAAGLIARLLDKDPARRITAAQALEHPWIHKGPGGEQVKTADKMEGAAPGGGCFSCFGSKPASGRSEFRDPSYHSMKVPAMTSAPFADSSVHPKLQGSSAGGGAASLIRTDQGGWGGRGV